MTSEKPTMLYFIGGVSTEGPIKKEEPITVGFEFVREIDHKEYKLVQEARTCLDTFQREASLFNIFIFGFNELESFRKLSERRLLARDATFDMAESIEGMDARLMALLSYYKTFLEYWKERIAETDSVYYKDVTQSLLDNNVSYRICYYLRNYAQHIGTPLVNCVINSDPQQVDVFFSIIKHRVLQAQLRHWPTKQEDLQNLPEQIQLEPYLEELKTQVKQLHLNFIGVDFSTVLVHYGRLNHLYAEVQTAVSESYPWIMSLDDDGVIQQVIDIPLEKMKTVHTTQAMLATR